MNLGFVGFFRLLFEEDVSLVFRLGRLSVVVLWVNFLFIVEGFLGFRKVWRVRLGGWFFS